MYKQFWTTPLRFLSLTADGFSNNNNNNDDDDLLSQFPQNSSYKLCNQYCLYNHTYDFVLYKLCKERKDVEKLYGTKGLTGNVMQNI